MARAPHALLFCSLQVNSDVMADRRVAVRCHGSRGCGLFEGETQEGDEQGGEGELSWATCAKRRGAAGSREGVEGWGGGFGGGVVVPMAKMETGTPPASGAGGRWFKSSRPDHKVKQPPLCTHAMVGAVFCGSVVRPVTGVVSSRYPRATISRRFRVIATPPETPSQENVSHEAPLFVSGQHMVSTAR